jgi:hypothetical protein
MPTAYCPHCGRDDAPTDQGHLERHRRADWDPDGDGPGNIICFAELQPVGKPCSHPPNSPLLATCADATGAA